ncbi:MAG: CDP-alcohol phosphatidyltransferase family protein [Dehalococcoidia bacterium]
MPRSAPKWMTEPVVRPLASIGVTPNMLTVLGLVGNAVAAYFAAEGEFIWAGVLVLLASALDMYDGALARATGQATPFGAVFDATLDRISEALVLFGLLVYFSDRGGQTEELLVFVAVVGSILVSYVRARAEVIGLTLREGAFTRFERVALMGVGLIVAAIADDDGIITYMLWILAALASFTALQRLAMVWLKSRDGAPPAE